VTDYLVDVRAHSDVVDLGDVPAWALDRDGWPFPPADLEPGNSGAFCFGCGLTPLDRRCEDCPRASTRIYREQLARPLLPDSRMRRFLSTFQRKATP
jgi:hypothetical protein